MALSDSSILVRYHSWRVFGTGTWSGSVPKEGLQRKVVFGFLYQTARLADLPFRKLVFALRHEMGEKTGREHLHWLIGSSEWSPSLSDCFRLNKLWESFPRAGMSRNHLFDARLNGIEYVTKCLSGSAFRDTLGGDFYEAGKFGGSEVTLSNSLVRCVGGRRVCVLRHSRI